MRLALPVAAGVFASSVCCGDLLSGLTGGGAQAPAELGLIVEAMAGPMTLSGSEPGFGAAGARFTLVEFVDFECPHCARMAPVLHEVAAASPDVRLIHRNYPLSSECNPQLEAPLHEHVCGAVVATACAREQGRFWELQAALFDHYTALGPEEITGYGADVGLDAAVFAACRARTSAMEVAAKDVAAGVALKLAGTPAIYLHGAYGDEWVSLSMGPGDGRALQALLESARTGKPLPPITPLPPEGAP